MTLAVPLRWLLGALMIVAATWDLRWRRIPNWLTAAGLAAGLALQAAIGGSAGLLSAIKGVGLALLVYIPLYALRGVGGGDLKLMAATGAIAGPENWLRIFVTTALLGGVCAIMLAWRRRVLGRTLRNVGRILAALVRRRVPYERHPELDVARPEALRLPHGAVIAAATFLWLVVVKV